MPFNETDHTIINPVTHQAIKPGQYYEGATHDGSEKKHDKKSLGALEKAAKEEVNTEGVIELGDLTDEEKLQIEIEAADAARESYNPGESTDETKTPVDLTDDEKKQLEIEAQKTAANDEGEKEGGK